jgi:Rod binding domain-containing protein
MPLEPLPTSPALPALPSRAASRIARLAEQARTGGPAAREELRRACEMLEAHFLNWLMREMRQTVHAGGLLPQGPTQETYDALLDDALAKAVARSGGIGIARTLEARLAPQAAPEGPGGRAGSAATSPNRTSAETHNAPTRPADGR